MLKRTITEYLPVPGLQAGIDDLCQYVDHLKLKTTGYFKLKRLGNCPYLERPRLKRELSARQKIHGVRDVVTDGVRATVPVDLKAKKSEKLPLLLEAENDRVPASTCIYPRYSKPETIEYLKVAWIT